MTSLPPQSEEKRRFHRVLYDAAAMLVSGEKRWGGKVLDVSLKGCLLELPESWEGDPRALYRVHIHLEGGLWVEMGVTLAHRHGRHVGLLCHDIDLDSICVLRRIVEMNLGDSALLERDFHALVHPRD